MSTKDYSRKQEHLIADTLGWDVVSGSGSRHTYPGDISSSEWLGECKTHQKPGSKIKFNRDVWNKIVEEASSQFKYPVLFVDDGSQTVKNTWCMFPGSIRGIDSKMITLPVTFGKNILFDPYYMKSKIKSERNTDINYRPIVYFTEFSTSVYITDLDTFSELFGEK